jgi:hypothetical protein
VSAGKLRKLWDSLSELHSSVCERLLERTILRPALLPAKTAQFTQLLKERDTEILTVAMPTRTPICLSVIWHQLLNRLSNFYEI